MNAFNIENNLFGKIIVASMFALLLFNVFFRRKFVKYKLKYENLMKNLDAPEALLLESDLMTKTTVGVLEDKILEEYGDHSKELKEYRMFERSYLMYRSFDIVTIIVFILYLVFSRFF